MKEIIRELAEALEQLTLHENLTAAESLIGELQGSRYAWVSDLPISIVHREEKLKAGQVRAFLLANGFFDDAGFSEIEQDLGRLKSRVQAMKSAFQTIDLAVLEGDAKMEKMTFQTRRPHDYWKRLNNVDALKAMVGLQCVDGSACRESSIEAALHESSNGQWPVESRLRDAMRSTKENSGLRCKPFVWVVIKTEAEHEPIDHIAMMLKHYFGSNVVEGRGNVRFYIGYMEELDAVSLREFYKKA
jgi:hypothetical protein